MFHLFRLFLLLINYLIEKKKKKEKKLCKVVRTWRATDKFDSSSITW